MLDKNGEKLNDLIGEVLNDLATSDLSGDERDAKINELKELYNMRLRETQIELESSEKFERLELDGKIRDEEEAYRNIQIENENKVREEEKAYRDKQHKLQLATLIITGATTVGYIALEVWEYVKGYQLETTGSVTSLFLKNVVGRKKSRK